MGVLDRLILRDDQWERMSAHIIGDERTRGSSGRDNRMFVEAVLVDRADRIALARSSGCVRRLEQRLPPFQPVEPQGGVVAHLRGDVGRSGLRVSDRRLHHRPRPPACVGGQKGGSEDQAIGRSRGGLSTKIHMAVRGLGCPVRFPLTAGQTRRCARRPTP